MANFAVLSGNVVNNIIVADSIDDAVNLTGSECVSILDDTIVSLGFIFNGETGEFSEPIIPEPALDVIIEPESPGVIEPGTPETPPAE